MCQSVKACNNCEMTIEVGTQYMTNPNKSLCLKCYAIEKQNNIDKSNNSGEVKNNDYTVSGICKFCEAPAIGFLWKMKVCAGHINEAIAENV